MTEVRTVREVSYPFYSINKVILIGNLGRDPDISTMQSGSRLVRLSIATTSAWYDKNANERREKTEWHRVVIFNEHYISLIERYVKKGAKIYIQGHLETRRWMDQSGMERYSTEVVLPQYGGEFCIIDHGSNYESQGRQEYNRLERLEHHHQENKEEIVYSKSSDSHKNKSHKGNNNNNSIYNFDQDIKDLSDDINDDIPF